MQIHISTQIINGSLQRLLLYKMQNSTGNNTSNWPLLFASYTTFPALS